MSGTQPTGPAGRDGRRRTGGGRVVVGLGIVAVALAAFGIWTRENALAALTVRAEDAAIPRVQVISPQPGPPRRSLNLPGNINAWYEAPIYAQVAGYVRMWYKDYGATVKSGELLAVIDSPTIDAQLAQAKAALAVAQARSKLAQVTAKRWQALSGTQAVSQQEVDVQTANAQAEAAQVAAAEQEVVRYQAQAGFEHVVAPFDGVVTARLTDVGDYVNGGGGDVGARGGAQELFSVSDIHEMRVFASIPQEYSDILKPGLVATLTLPQSPGRVYQAHFLTTANAVNPQTRTVVTELTVDNPKHELLPGSYATVHFTAPANQDILILPEQALLFRAQGMQVALVDAQDRVHLQNITLGLNLGTTVQVLAGLKASDRLINNPSMGMLEGEKVKPVQPVAGYGEPQAGAKPTGASEAAQEPARSGTAVVEPAGEPNAGDETTR